LTILRVVILSGAVVVVVDFTSRQTFTRQTGTAAEASSEPLTLTAALANHLTRPIEKRESASGVEAQETFRQLFGSRRVLLSRLSACGSDTLHGWHVLFFVCSFTLLLSFVSGFPARLSITAANPLNYLNAALSTFCSHHVPRRPHNVFLTSTRCAPNALQQP
jgi:hypothetical protein